METISQRWARFALELDYEKIPPKAINEAKKTVKETG